MAVEWGQAKIELLVLQNEIREQLDKGVAVRKIYKEFREGGRITMSERSFYIWVKRFERTQDKAPKSIPANTVVTKTTDTASLPESSPKSEVVDAALPRLNAGGGPPTNGISHWWATSEASSEDPER